MRKRIALGMLGVVLTMGIVDKADAQTWRSEPSMVLGQLPIQWGTEAEKIWRMKRESEEPTYTARPSYHRWGAQWGLFAAKVPMAWEITMGDPSVNVLVMDVVVSTTDTEYGKAGGVGRSGLFAGFTGGREDLVNVIHQQSSPGGPWSILDSENENSSASGNIHVWETYNATTGTWEQSPGSLLPSSTSDRYAHTSYRLSQKGGAGHGLNVMSVMASPHNGKGMLGIAPGATYQQISRGSGTASGYDFRPDIEGQQPAHVINASTDEILAGTWGTPALLVAKPIDYAVPKLATTPTPDDPNKRINLSAWLDTRTVRVGLWHDGVKYDETTTTPPIPTCLPSFDRTIDVKKYQEGGWDHNGTMQYAFWHQVPQSQGTQTTSSQALYETSNDCGTTEGNGPCWRLRVTTHSIPGTSQMVDVVVPSDIFCETGNGTSEWFKNDDAESFRLPFVNGIAALMRSVDLTGGVNIVEETVHAGFSTMQVTKNLNLGTANKYVSKYETHRRMRDIITFTAKKVANPDWTYTVQDGDPMRRSYSWNYGYGLVDAYRCVAQSIPAKGLAVYNAGTPSIDFANGTTVNGRKLVHFGAYGRDDLGAPARLFDNPVSGYIPPNAPLNISAGKTEVSNVTLAVGTGNTLVIDGILTGVNGKVQTTAAQDGRIMMSGYLDGVNLEGTLTIGDLDMASGTVTFKPATGATSHIYGEVIMRDNSELLIPSGYKATLRPGAKVVVAGNKDITIGNGAQLVLDYGCDIVSPTGSRKIIVESGGQLVLLNDARSVNLNIDIVVKTGGKIVFGSTPGNLVTMCAKSIKFEGTASMDIAGKARIERLIGSTQPVDINLDNATTDLMVAGGKTLELEDMTLKQGKRIVVQPNATLTFEHLLTEPSSVINVLSGATMNLRGTLGSSFVVGGKLFVEGSVGAMATVQGLTNKDCRAQVPRLLVKADNMPFTTATSGPNEDLVSTGFKANYGLFKNVYVDLVNAPIINVPNGNVLVGWGTISNSRFEMSRGDFYVKNAAGVKTGVLQGFVDNGAMLNIDFTLPMANATGDERTKVNARIRTVTVLATVFKDGTGLFDVPDYYNLSRDQQKSQYAVSGVSTKKLKYLSVSGNSFAYLNTGVSTEGSQENTFSQNLFVHGFNGITDKLSQNIVCDNEFSEIMTGVKFTNALASRLTDNTFGAQKTAAGPCSTSVFCNDANWIGAALETNESGPVFLRNNTVMDFRSGIYAKNGSQVLQYTMTGLTQAEVYGRNLFVTDPARMQQNKFQPLIQTSGGRQNEARDLYVNLSANVKLACGYSKFARHSKYHIDRNDASTNNDMKYVNVNQNAWLRPKPGQPALDNYVVAVGPKVTAQGTVLNIFDVVPDNCGRMVEQRDVGTCGDDLTYGDGRGSGYSRNWENAGGISTPPMMIADLGGLQGDITSNTASLYRRYDALVFAYQIVNLLEDNYYHGQYQGACTYVAQDTNLPCFIRSRAYAMKGLSLLDMGYQTLAQQAMMNAAALACADTDTNALSLLSSYVQSASTPPYSPAGIAAKASRIGSAAEDSRLKFVDGSSLARQPIAGEDISASSSMSAHVDAGGVVVDNPTGRDEHVRAEWVNYMGQVLHAEELIVPAGQTVQMERRLVGGTIKGIYFVRIFIGGRVETYKGYME